MDLTPQQLSQYNGTDPSKPIYVAIKGVIYDVTTGKSFYGPGGAYAMFAGKDASRALAKMSKNEEDVTPNLDGLDEKQIGVLNDWVQKFQAKYPVVGRAGLSFNFYATSCPAAEFMVSNTVRSASSADPTIPGKLLRLLFHDCFVEGCDASVLLQGNGTERSDPANTSVGGFSVIDSAKRVLEIFCPGTVSCADIIALAARDAVAIAGGPEIAIPTGRRDGKVSSALNVRPNIVDTSFTMDEMLKLFNSKGLSLDDLVTLSGAHTIGVAHCNAFSDRFGQNSKGKLTLIDKSLDTSYAEELMKKCPAGVSSSTTVNNDPATSFAFDNQYYSNLLAHKGLFQSDSVLLEDGRTRKQVEAFANDQESFFRSWGESFLKLTTIEVKTDDEGEIRRSCSFATN
ncbi:Plant peroxidase [Corchorus capsularis]|uniref:Peroxidase n=1 Tax=Corchorus capsularis TaxID=210143 RepID=A0A1R3GU34_COCAP|nr:Plant peroxidase [Corchorus capsularis]